jgi:hypothetical protein
VFKIWPTKILYLIKKKALCISLVILTLFQAAPLRAEDQGQAQPSTQSQPSISDRQQEEINQLRQRIQFLEDKESVAETHPQFGLNLGAYGDINYFTKNREAEHSSFSLGSLDLYSTAQVGSRLTFLAEMQLELDEASSEGNFDLERFWVGYTFNDLLTVRAGRTHTALGYWNITYHHGKQLFLTVDRPFFLAFEDDGGVLPVHTIGIELMGSQSLPALRWMYSLDIGNGHHIDTATKLLVPDDIADSNNSKQVALRLSIEPTRLPGLTLGIFGTSDRVAVDSNDNIDERIFGGDFSYIHDKVEFITEYYRMLNPGHHANAYYIQLGYKIARDITPYARYESLNDVDPTDPYFSLLENNTSRYQKIAGVRYDIDELRSALKLQYRIDRKLGSETFHVWEAQWSFSF